MHRFVVSFASFLLFAALSSCQTPPNTSPAGIRNLGVRYGNTTVTPNALLAQSLVATQPVISLNITLPSTYMVALVDLSIPPASINTTGPLVPGLEPGRTTRLHWLQTGLQQAANGSFASNVSALAVYGGPMPGLNDIPHTYTFYFFAQPANFTLPAYDAGRDYTASSARTRLNFSVDAIASQAGSPLVAANYIRVVNPNNTATGTAANGTAHANATTTASGSASSTSKLPVSTGGAAAGLGYSVSAMLSVLGVVVFVTL